MVNKWVCQLNKLNKRMRYGVIFTLDEKRMKTQFSLPRTEWFNFHKINFKPLIKILDALMSLKFHCPLFVMRWSSAAFYQQPLLSSCIAKLSTTNSTKQTLSAYEIWGNFIQMIWKEKRKWAIWKEWDTVIALKFVAYYLFLSRFTFPFPSTITAVCRENEINFFNSIVINICL